LFPEIARAIKRFLPDSGETIELGLSKKYGWDYSALETNWYLQNGYYNTAAKLLGGQPAWSGETVSIDTVLQHSVIWACQKIIGECVGFTPAILKQQTSTGTRDATDHPMYRAMKMAPNEEISAHGFTELLTGHALLSGNAFAKITRRSGTGTAIRLDVLLPEQVKPDREKNGQKRLIYVVSQKGEPDKTYTVEVGKPQDIFHLRGMGWDGVRGYSVVALGRQSMGTAIAAERNLANFWSHGGRPPYHIEVSQKFADKTMGDQFRTDVQRVSSNPWDPAITEPWWKIVYPSGGSMRDAQGIENRIFTVSEMCRWFNVSPPLVHDLSRATFNNIEELFLQFKNFTMSAWYSRWEDDFYRCVLTPDEQDKGYLLRHDTRELLRGDFLKRMQGYSQALQNGVYSIDEARAQEDMDALADDAGTHHHIQLNMQTLPDDGSPPPTPAPKEPNSNPMPKGLFRLS
jgi:HK97 family phage portal protein